MRGKGYLGTDKCFITSLKTTQNLGHPSFFLIIVIGGAQGMEEGEIMPCSSCSSTSFFVTSHCSWLYR